MNIEKCNGCAKIMLIKSSYNDAINNDKIVKLDNRKYTPLCKICLDAVIDNYYNFSKSIDGANLSQDLFNDVELIIAENTIWIKKSEWKKKLCSITKSTKQQNREYHLMQNMKELKLEYDSCRITNGYIKYGKPSLDTVLKYLTDKQNKKNIRMYRLINFLDKNGTYYNSILPSHSKYINHGGNLHTVLNDGIFETFLIDNTDYIFLLKKYDHEKAKEIALIKYVQNGGSHELSQKFIADKTTIKFE